MNVRLAVQRAIRLHSNGQFAAAADAYRAILKRHPKTCSCWSNLGMALRTLGRKDEGLVVLRQGARVCPRSPELNYNLGNALKDAGDHEGALKHYRAAWNLDPDSLKAALACGAMLMRRGRPEQAIEHYGAALGRNPDDSKLCAGLGLALWKLGRPAAAAVLRRAVTLNPASSDLRRHLHDVLRWLGYDEEDEEQLRAGLAREPDSPLLLAALGQSLIAQGRLDEGLACCGAVLKVDPDDQEARLARGRANFLAGRNAGGLAGSLPAGRRAELHPPVADGATAARLNHSSSARPEGALLRGHDLGRLAVVHELLDDASLDRLHGAALGAHAAAVTRDVCHLHHRSRADGET